MNSDKKVESITVLEAANFLLKNDNFYILTHVNPDGDAMGSGFGLCRALRAVGKKANVLCSDPFPKRYSYLYNGYEPQKFVPQTIVSVDLADTNLFGKALSVYADFVDLAIDHHISNTGYAAKTLLNGKAAAACEVLFEVFTDCKFPIFLHTAECL